MKEDEKGGRSTMPRMLIVDDETSIREFIRKYAEYEGYAVTEAQDGAQAVERCRQTAFDLVVMDLLMPDMDGFEAIRTIRTFSTAPIIVCSALTEEHDRLRCFSLGADDFVPKPFSPRELMMRAAAIRKRVEHGAEEPPAAVYACGGLVVDFTARKVSIDGDRIDLSPREYELLFYLVRNRNVALTRQQLLSEVWGPDFTGDERTLDTHIKLLRRRLGPYARQIVTMRGVGYRFEG